LYIDYLRKDYRFSYLATQGGLKIDLIVERPGQRACLVEIKSSTEVRDDQLRFLHDLLEEFPEFDAMCLSRETVARKIGRVTVMPWRQGMLELGL